MIRAIRCELARLKNPSFILGGIGLMVVLGLMATTVIFMTAKAGSTPAPPGVKFVTVAMLEASDGMFAGLQNAASMLGIVALALWAISVTSDYANGLIRLLVQAEPSRLRLLGGKIVALTLFTCLATLVTTVVVVLVSPGIAGLAGVSTDAWGTDLPRTVVEALRQPDTVRAPVGRRRVCSSASSRAAAGWPSQWASATCSCSKG